jgi:hypothetical protein
VEETCSEVEELPATPPNNLGAHDELKKDRAITIPVWLVTLV